MTTGILQSFIGIISGRSISGDQDQQLNKTFHFSAGYVDRKGSATWFNNPLHAQEKQESAKRPTPGNKE